LPSVASMYRGVRGPMETVGETAGESVGMVGEVKGC
jgi:hypothetical protein